MNCEPKALQRSSSPWETVSLYTGIELFFWNAASSPFPPEQDNLEHILHIIYCRAGKMICSMQHQSQICLNPGDFFLRSSHRPAELSCRFPTGQCQGLAISINPVKAAERPPELLKGTDLFHPTLGERFCRGNAALFFPANEQTRSIFSGFYGQPEELKLPYQRLKTLELLLYLAQAEYMPQNSPPEYPSEQIRIVREIHDHLIRNMERRITIEELSRQYLVNPTTLKAAFKSVYGTSLAAHIKSHRMEQAARMLRESDWSIAEIAQAVGYDSQSRFTAAFKEVFDILPSAYRKQNHQ